MKKFIVLMSLLLITSFAYADETGGVSTGTPFVIANKGLVDHTHYYDSKHKDLDYGAKLELILWKVEDDVLLDEIRIDVSHEVERNETSFFAVLRVPLFKLWQK